MSASVGKNTNWVYRIFDRRTVSVKAKNEQVRKIAAVDLQTNTPFSIDVPQEVPLKNVQIEKEYLAALKVFTARDISGVPQDSLEFFKVLDVDHSMEQFVKAYWLYPKQIKFELVEVEPL